MSARRVCLVADELFPLTAGGIGRVLHNLIVDSASRQAGVEFHVLVPSYVSFERAQFEAYFGSRAQLHYASPRAEWEPTFDADGSYPPPGAFTDSRWHAESLELMLHLKMLERSGIRFDVIEFPDYKGWGYCSLQEKYLGRAFATTELAVRLHSTYGVIAQYEPHLVDKDGLSRHELERKALLDAERVVAHLPNIGEYNRAFYGLPSSWLDKVDVEFPPVTLEAPAPPRAVEGDRDLLFLTKVQWIKRPDLFVRGAALFMRQNPEYRGRAVVACHAPFSDYTESVKRLVPADLRERFVFQGPQAGREEAMARGIVVIPSDHEALNLTAYEAAAAGAQLVLNAACAAFAPGTPFVDGQNCHTFDGSVEGLAETLQRAVREGPLEPVRWEAASPYWEQAPVAALRAPASARTQPPLVTVLITNFNLARYLPQTLASVAASDYPEIEVVVVDDASTDPFDREALEQLEARQAAHGDAAVRVVRNAVNRGLPASRNIGLSAATGQYVLPLDADDCISPGFIRMAVEALERHPEFDVVVPTTGYFNDDEALEAREFCDYAIFLGDVPSLSLVANRLSCATSLMRRSLFERYRYNERLSSFEDWDLYLRLIHGGHRFLVTNQVHFHYRRRPGSMISGVGPRRHLELLRQMYRGLPTPMHPGTNLAAFFSLTGPLPEAGVTWARWLGLAEPTESKPPRHDVVDRMNGALKRVPLVHPLLKTALGAMGADPATPLRYQVVDRLNAAAKRLPVLHAGVKRTTRALLPGKR